MSNPPFRTCTRTLEISVLEGAQEYFPESARSAFSIRRYDVVDSPFAVRTVIPPRSES